MKPTVPLLLALFALPLCSCRAVPESPGAGADAGSSAPVLATLPGGPVELPPVADFLARLRAASPSNAVVCVLGLSPEVRSSAARKAIADAGAERLSALPGGACLARGTAAQLAAVLETGVFSTGREYLPSDKGPSPAPDAAPAVFAVSPFPGTDSAVLCAALAAIPGCDIVSDPADSPLRARLSPSAHRAAAALPDVQALSPWFEPTILSPTTSPVLP